MSQMLKSSGAMAAATMTSRVLGLVREIVYAGFMGAGWVAGAFMFAFTIPNLFRRLLGEGALTAAFIPLFKEKEKTEGDREMWRAANAVLSGLTLALGALVALAMGGVAVALWMGEFSAKTDLMLRLLVVMFPYVLLVCLAAVFMGMLNARGRFFVPSLGAALLNVVLIASALFLAPRFGLQLHDQIYGLAVGVLAAGVVQAAFQTPLLHKDGFRARWVSPWSDPTVRRVVQQIVPATVGVAAYQINVLLTQGIAFWVEADIVASFNFAVRLMELPQGVFGLSLATYLLPTLSGLAAEKKWVEFRDNVGRGLGYLVFINLLAAVILAVLAEPIIRLLFERGRFEAPDTARAAAALLCLAPGLLAFSVVNIAARAFYAVGDVKTPMRISVFCLGLNVVLVGALIWKFREAGLGLANTVTGFLNAALLLYALRRKLGQLDLAVLWRALPGLAGAAMAAGATAWAIVGAWSRHLGHGNLVGKLGEVFVPMTVATLLYLLLSAWLRVPYLDDVLALLRPRSAGKPDSGDNGAPPPEPPAR